MKKKMPLFFIIPGVAIAIVVGVAILIKVTAPKPVPSVSTDFPNAINDSQTGNPRSFLGSLFGGPKPTPSPATANDLSTQLKNTYDDGGASDLNALQQQASGL